MRDFVNAAILAREAGYDGVEVMGSEGYLINQFLVAETNKRSDRWGGDFERRCQFPAEILSRMREAVGNDFLIMYRLSMLDLVAGGSDWIEVERLASNHRASWSQHHQYGNRMARSEDPNHRDNGASRGIPIRDQEVDGKGWDSLGNHQSIQYARNV